MLTVEPSEVLFSDGVSPLPGCALSITSSAPAIVYRVYSSCPERYILRHYSDSIPRPGQTAKCSIFLSEEGKRKTSYELSRDKFFVEGGMAGDGSFVLQVTLPCRGIAEYGKAHLNKEIEKRRRDLQVAKQQIDADREMSLSLSTISPARRKMYWKGLPLY